MTTRLYVVRHGQSTHNRDGIVSGHDDNPELTPQGIAEAEEAKRKLAHVQFDEIYSSDLERASHTAAIISGHAVIPSHQLKGLRERKFGHVDGGPSHELTALRETPGFQALSLQERWYHRFTEDMESDQDTSSRFIETLLDIARENLGKTILVASHGGTLRVTLIRLGYAKPEELPYGSIDNAAYAEVIYDEANPNLLTIGEIGGVNKVVPRSL